jgi:hypothetical protein
MLARGLVGKENQPSALLQAPTTSLVAFVAMQEDAALRVGELFSLTTPVQCTKIHVVHGRYDNAFCPHQHRWNAIQGIELHIVPDNHILMRSSSLTCIVQILTQLVTEDRIEQRNMQY